MIESKVNLPSYCSCLDRESAKRLFSLQVKLPTAHLSTTHSGCLTLPLFIAEYQEYQAGKLKIC